MELAKETVQSVVDFESFFDYFEKLAKSMKLQEAIDTAKSLC